MKHLYKNGKAPERGDIVIGLVDGKQVFGVVVSTGNNDDGVYNVDMPELVVLLDCRNSVKVSLDTFVPDMEWNWSKVDYSDPKNLKWKEEAVR